MSAAAWVMAGVMVLTVGTLAFLVWSMWRSMHNERSGERTLWREFGLGIVLMILFFASWGAQLVTEWQVFTDNQAAHGQAVKAGDFVAEFLQSTFENWQSEFLQLFSFVVLAALYIHKGSAESKDSDDKVEASLRRIEEHLGTWPGETGRQAPWQLPDTPLQAND